MTSTLRKSIAAPTDALKRTHTWPPSQWCLDRFTEQPDSPILETDRNAAQEPSQVNEQRPLSLDVLPTSHERQADLLQPDSSSNDTASETSSLKAASHKAVCRTPNRSTTHFSPQQPLSGGSKANLVLFASASEKKASFRERHFKRWSRDMSRTSKRVARHLFPRKSKEQGGSIEMENQSQPPEEDERPRGRSRSRQRHHPHEMSGDNERSPRIIPVPPIPTVPERRSSVVWYDVSERGRRLDIPRRDLLDLNGGIQAAAGMPHQVRRRHASGKRKASKEPQRDLQDIKEEWNASQVFRDEWAARVRGNVTGSPGALRGRASSDSSIPSAYLSS